MGCAGPTSMVDSGQARNTRSTKKWSTLWDQRLLPRTLGSKSKSTTTDTCRVGFTILCNLLCARILPRADFIDHDGKAKTKLCNDQGRITDQCPATSSSSSLHWVCVCEYLLSACVSPSAHAIRCNTQGHAYVLLTPSGFTDLVFTIFA